MNVLSFAHNDCTAGEPLHYTACGLDNVYLASGYEVREIAGERYTSVRDVEDLHRAIAVSLVSDRKVLSGKEIRFLRRYLDLTQRELGGLMGVSDQSVARYEKEQSALEGSNDALLRLLVCAQAEEKINVREVLEKLRAADDVGDGALTLERSDEEWRVAA